MNMIYCTCNIGVLSEVMNVFTSLQIGNYQILGNVKAKQIKGEPRLDTEVWPGMNAIVITHLPDDKTKEFFSAIKELNKKTINDDELITLCRYKLDEFIFD